MCGVRSKVVLLHVLYTERIPGPTVSYRNRHVFATIYSHHIPALSSGNRTFPADARCCTSRQVFPAALKGSPRVMSPALTRNIRLIASSKSQTKRCLLQEIPLDRTPPLTTLSVIYRVLAVSSLRFCGKEFVTFSPNL